MGEDNTGDSERGARPRVYAIARPGVAGSLLLHGAMLALLLHQIGAPPVPLPVIPVDFVQLAEQTVAAASDAPAARARANAAPSVASLAPPRSAVPRPRANPVPESAAAPPSADQPAPDVAPPAPADALQTQLEALAKLRVQSGDGTGRSLGRSGPAGYRVEDLVRAQVQRRWNLRLDELGERELTITIHIVVEEDGTVAKAEIVEPNGGEKDDVYHSIALAARNAVLLSSPLSLPTGMTMEMRDMTVSFNTRDTLR